MSPPVVAIGLDAANPSLLERWMDQGHLPNLARFRAEGTWGHVNNVRYYRTETSWITFLTGALPRQTGEWGHVRYDVARHRAEELSAYAFETHPPFYALPENKKVAVFDPPLARLYDGVSGAQVLGWGTEANQCLRTSDPNGLMDELIARHGAHPMFAASKPTVNEQGEQVYSYRIPSSYDLPGMLALRDDLVDAARRRASIMGDLLCRQQWDLFLGVFAETHTASHLLWHLSQEHPLRDELARGLDGDPLLDVFTAVDAALGEVLDMLSADTRVLLFSIYGIAENVLDLPSMVFLPELLYRWRSDGECLLQGTSDNGLRLDYAAHWKDEVWNLRTKLGDEKLESPALQHQRGDPMHWQPGNWYRKLWPSMPAFALPTYSEGLIRLNIQGRDPGGCLPAATFGDVCTELRNYLSRLLDKRTGRRMIEEIVQTRDTPFENADKGPPADLIVLWREGGATDHVHHPQVGDIGPMPYFRSGGHCSTGFVAARGNGVRSGHRAADIQAVDLTATILSWLEQPIPDYVHSEGAFN